MIDEKKIEEGLNQYVDDDSIYDFGLFARGFNAGVNWFLDNLWHDASEKPKTGEEMFIQLYEDNSWHSALFNGYDFDVNDMNKESEYSVQPIEITRWFYIDDLLK